MNLRMHANAWSSDAYVTVCDCQLHRLWKPKRHALIIRKQRFKRSRAHIRHMYLQRQHARAQTSIDVFEAYVGAIIVVTCYADPVLSMQHDNLSYHSGSESALSEALFEYQQCQRECADDMSDGSGCFQDIVSLPDHALASSTFGARGSVQKSSLLPSDAEQMLRVRKSMAHAGHRACVSSFTMRSLCEEACFSCQCIFDELSMNYPDVQQLQRLLSQYWIRSW